MCEAMSEAPAETPIDELELPPDPEGENDNRARWAEVALDAFMERTGTDLEDAICDLTCDLMHWCDRNDQVFELELDRGYRHYAEEIDPGEGDVEGNLLKPNDLSAAKELLAIVNVEFIDPERIKIEDAIRDVHRSLMIWCERHGYDFERELGRARGLMVELEEEAS